MKFHRPDNVNYWPNYARAMSKRRPESVLESNRFNFYLGRDDIRVYQDKKSQQVSAVIGQLSEILLDDGDPIEVFKATHFSPASMREGVSLLKKMAKVRNRMIIFTVTEDLNDMLIGCGFSPTGISFKMEWNGETHTKYVFTQFGFEPTLRSVIDEYCDF